MSKWFLSEKNKKRPTGNLYFEIPYAEGALESLSLSYSVLLFVPLHLMKKNLVNCRRKGMLFISPCLTNELEQKCKTSSSFYWYYWWEKHIFQNVYLLIF